VSPDVAKHECAWLDPNKFVDEDLGAFWKEVIDTGDSVAAAVHHNVTDRLLQAQSQVLLTTRPTPYAKEISQGTYFSDVYKIVLSMVREVGAGDYAKVSEWADKLGQISPVSSVDAYTTTDIDSEFQSMLKTSFPLVKTGLDTLDRSLGGLFGSEMSILSARPGVGKTAFATHVARNVAEAHNTVLFFSVEMSRTQLWGRMACPLAGISWTALRAGEVTQEQKDKVAAASRSLEAKYGDFLLIQDEVRTLEEMHQVVIRHKPMLVVVDHLDEIVWHNDNDSEVKWYGEAAKYIRQRFSRDVGCHTMLIHQLNRDVENRSDKRPKLSDLRGSGKLEQIADTVLMGYREDLYDECGVDYGYSVPFELWVRKHRQGQVNVLVDLTYNLREQQFKDGYSGYS
jgi:replicative DNA helicase